MSKQNQNFESFPLILMVKLAVVLHSHSSTSYHLIHHFLNCSGFQNLKFLNLHVTGGDDDLTCDKDWKHIFKRWCNLLIRPNHSIVINGHQITADVIMDQFGSEGLTTDLDLYSILRIYKTSNWLSTC
jgi:hypothetical protein